MTHKDTAQLVNYGSWLSRGWCLAELWCRLLANKADTSVIVIFSAGEGEFVSPLDWQSNSVAEGNFTVEADRAVVVRLGEMAVESKIRHLQQNGPLSHYRFYSALRPKLLRQQQEARDLDAFLQQFRFDSLEDAVKDDSSMSAVMCAVMSGDKGMLRLLASSRADVDRPLHGLGDFGYYDTQTPLMAATKSQQKPSLLATLVELRADVNARSRTDMFPLFICRSAEHVKVLLNCRADMPHSALSGVSMFAGPDAVQVLLDHRCDPTHESEASPLNSVAMLARGNRRAVEVATLLISRRADLNAREVIPDGMIWDCRKAQLQMAFAGFRNCSAKTRYAACMPGLTPLGYAAVSGHEQLVRLFLEHGADHLPNERGDMPEDLARYNCYHHVVPLLATFAT